MNNLDKFHNLFLSDVEKIIQTDTWHNWYTFNYNYIFPVESIKFSDSDNIVDVTMFKRKTNKITKWGAFWGNTEFLQ